MASLSHDTKNKRWLIQFMAFDRSRRSVSIKETRARDKGLAKAAVLKNRIEELATNAKTGTSMSSQLVR